MHSRLKPIACNLWSQARRAKAYASCLRAMTISAMMELDGGLLCPFLMDFALTADQRVELWRVVWDERTLVRTAKLSPDCNEHLLHSVAAA